MVNIEEYNKTGFQLVKGLFDKERIEQIHNEAKAIFLSQMIALKYPVDSIKTEEDYNKLMFRLFEERPDLIISCGKHIQHLISLHQLGLDDKIVNILKQLGLGFPNICTRPMFYFNASKLAKKQVYWKMDPHQDWRSMQGSLNSMVAWVAMCDIDISLGTLEIVPGSHLEGLKATEMVDSFGLVPESAIKDKFIPVEVKKGDVLFFSSFLVHQSGNNSTENGIRWSCHFRYNDMQEKDYISRGFPHPYVYYPNPDLITPNYPNSEIVKQYFG